MNCVEVKPFYNLLTIILQRNEGLPDTAGWGFLFTSLKDLVTINTFLFLRTLL
jgi:hypothetical protein